MRELRYTLLSDGSSDKALLPLLTWLLRSHQVDCAIQPNWADLRRLPNPPKKLLPRIISSLELYPCELLFVHRDAEKELYEKRVVEIQEVISQVKSKSEQVPPFVCVVPVRMQEAWLLFDEKALRRAAANPNGHQQLDLPDIAKLEQLPDPKKDLHQLLRTASGLKGRKLKNYSVHEGVHRVAELIDDFAPLRCLPAFIKLETEIGQVIKEQDWCSK